MLLEDPVDSVLCVCVCVYVHVCQLCCRLCWCVCVCLLHSLLLTFGLLQGLSYKKEVVLTTGQGGPVVSYI